ncbi:MAG: CAP domain-containing protein [Alphaproteobacteria bacterium]|nr:CAP domain-containing protein [Alphaproteobacteria bacterium]
MIRIAQIDRLSQFVRLVRRGAAIAALALWPIVGATAAFAQPDSRDLLRAFNKERESRRLPQLTQDPRLARAADRIARAIGQGQGVERGDNAECAAIDDAGFPCPGVIRLYALNGGEADQAARFLFESRKTGPSALTVEHRHIGVGGVSTPGGGVSWVVLIGQPPAPAPRSWRRDVLAEINAFRRQYGLIPLTLAPLLNEAAQRHADDMAYNDYVAHLTPDGRDPGARASATGYQWALIVENLANGQPTPAEAVDAWKKSDSHRRAMLNRQVTEAGIGYRFIQNDRGAVRSFHYWALSMGLPQS